MTDYTKLKDTLEADRLELIDYMARMLEKEGNIRKMDDDIQHLANLQTVLQAIYEVQAEEARDIPLRWPKPDVPDSIATATWNTGDKPRGTRKVPLEGKI